MSGNPGPELLRDFTAAFNTRDLDAVMAYFTDDAVFVSPRGPDPWGTKFAGKLRVREGLAARFAGLPDLHYGDDQHFVAGDRGASGSIGTAAVQLAKDMGAEVTAVVSTKNLELARSLGAHAVIDYTQEDFTQNGKRYDVVFDSVGKQSFRRSRRSLKRGGTFLETDLGFMWHVPALLLLTRWIGDKKVKMGIPHYAKEDVGFLKGLIEAGKYRAVIDRLYPLEDVIEAVKYVETGQKTGNVVLTVVKEADR